MNNLKSSVRLEVLLSKVGQDSAIPKQNISTEDIVSALVDLKLPFNPRNYQVDAIRDGVNDKRLVMLSPTGSGKSLII